MCLADIPSVFHHQRLLVGLSSYLLPFLLDLQLFIIHSLYCILFCIICNFCYLWSEPNPKFLQLVQI